VPIEGKLVSRSIESAQSQVEAQNYEIRKNVLKYDDVLNRQRRSSTTSAAGCSRARTSRSRCATS
jgi:preprotein translocase subunit SecA